ncbi:MAG: rod shape-determining protein RodA [Bacteroidales bacterium]
MKRNVNIWMSIDKLSVVLFLILVVMGWLNIYAAVYNDEHKAILDFSQRYGKQFLWVLATLVVAIFVMLIDNRFYFFFGYFIYGFLLLLLMLVLVLGTEINGARSWFEIGPFSLQPSEFAKAGTALALARYLNSRGQELTKFRILAPAVAIIMIPAALTSLQPDLGSVVIYFSFFIVLLREGLSPYIFISGLLAIVLFFLTLLLDNLYLSVGVVAAAFLLTWFAVRNWKLCLVGFGILALNAGLVYLAWFLISGKPEPELVILLALLLTGPIYGWYVYRQRAFVILVMYLFLTGSIVFVNSVDYAFNHLMKPHQKERVEILLGFRTDPYGKGYNVNQSVISIGSGGLAGKGYLQGTQTKFKFVPAQSTDFIFCTVGEEWGFLGSFVVIGLYVALLIRLVQLAERQRSSFSRIYGYGVISILLVHFFINIGMAVGLLPVIGIPLPFFSYGGSSLWGFTILLFIFLRLDASRTEYLV